LAQVTGFMSIKLIGGISVSPLSYRLERHHHHHHRDRETYTKKIQPNSTVGCDNTVNGTMVP